MSLSKTLYPLLSTGSTQEDPPDMTDTLLTGTKNQNKKYVIFFMIE